jgi:hypothetical protein
MIAHRKIPQWIHKNFFHKAVYTRYDIPSFLDSFKNSGNGVGKYLRKQPSDKEDCCACSKKGEAW